MKLILRLILSVPLLALAHASAATVQYSITDAGVTGGGDPIRRFHYAFTDMSLALYQEIEIRFDPAVFVSIFNPLGPANFDVIYLQVNNPPGSPGTYSIVSLADNPSLDGPFSIDTVLVGSVPATLSYYINQLTLDNGVLVFQGQLSSGAAFNTNGVPEPGSYLYVVFGGIALGGIRVWRSVRRGRGQPASASR